MFSQSPNQAKGFESVELGELDKREEQQRREKVPRRIIHFSSGETMEEYSTDEEEGEDKEPEMKDLLSSPVDAVRVRNSGGTGNSFVREEEQCRLLVRVGDKEFVFSEQMPTWPILKCDFDRTFWHYSHK